MLVAWKWKRSTFETGAHISNDKDAISLLVDEFGMPTMIARHCHKQGMLSRRSRCVVFVVRDSLRRPATCLIKLVANTFPLVSNSIQESLMDHSHQHA